MTDGPRNGRGRGHVMHFLIQGLVHICGTYRIDADKWSATLRRFHAASRAIARGARHAEASATTLNDDYATIDAHATQVNSERPRSLVAAILKIEKSRYLANGSIGLQKLWSDYAERVSWPDRPLKFEFVKLKIADCIYFEIRY